jgi:GDPmannose 4,6-dehydratase
MNVLITGIRGQDATILKSRLLKKGAIVFGVVRPTDPLTVDPQCREIALDISSNADVSELIRRTNPQQFYHLAACHHSSEQSPRFPDDEMMLRTNFLATDAILRGVAAHAPECRVFLAGSSYMYQAVHGQTTAISETTPMSPVTFYSLTKAWSRQLLAHYRNTRGVFGSMGILFNHESHLRSKAFLSRKISLAAAHAKLGRPVDLQIRDITAEVDWSSAEDVVEGMMLATTADEPEDFVLASGVSTSVEALLRAAFEHVGLDWKKYAIYDNRLKGKAKGILIGNPDLAKKKLGWNPKCSIQETIRIMVDHDLRSVLTNDTPKID